MKNAVTLKNISNLAGQRESFYAIMGASVADVSIYMRIFGLCVQIQWRQEVENPEQTVWKIGISGQDYFAAYSIHAEDGGVMASQLTPEADCSAQTAQGFQPVSMIY